MELGLCSTHCSICKTAAITATLSPSSPPGPPVMCSSVLSAFPYGLGHSKLLPAWDSGINYKLRKKQAHTVHAKDEIKKKKSEKLPRNQAMEVCKNREDSIWWPFMGGRRTGPAAFLATTRHGNPGSKFPHILTLFSTQGGTMRSALSGFNIVLLATLYLIKNSPILLRIINTHT